jgi:hypothetical protein
MGFWKDWQTRLGISLGAVTLFGNFIYWALQSIGIVPRWRNPPTLQERLRLERDALYFVAIPLFLSFCLILMGADGALKRHRRRPKDSPK